MAFRFSKVQNHVSCCYQGSVFLDSKGNVFCTGDNNSNELGLPIHQKYYSPTKLNIQHHRYSSERAKIVAVSAGYSQSLIFLSNEGSVYETNQSSYVSRSVERVKVIKELLQQRIVKISHCNSRSLFLNDEGDVFCRGYNSENIFGISKFNDETVKLEKITFCKEKFKLIGCGDEHVVFVTVSNKVFACGKNGKCQLSCGDNRKQSKIPVRTLFNGLKKGESIQEISIGMNHNLFLTSNRRVFASGSNQSFQCGSQSDGGNEHLKIVCPFRGLENFIITKIATGRYHSAFITNTNQLYVCGQNTYNELKEDIKGSVRTPTLVTNKLMEGYTILDIGIGYNHSVIVAKDSSGNGAVFSRGFYKYGSLGIGILGVERRIVLFEKLNFVLDIISAENEKFKENLFLQCFEKTLFVDLHVKFKF